MKSVFNIAAFSLLATIASCQPKHPQPKHPMPNMGMTYVHFWKYSDSVSKIIFDSAGNYKKEWKNEGDKIFSEAVKRDNFDDSIYKVKYHFSDYYYMWNYTTETSQGWGENDITLDHRPTEQEIKGYVWNTMFKNEKGRKWTALEIVGVSAKSNDPYTLENISPEQKGQLNYTKSVYKQLH